MKRHRNLSAELPEVMTLSPSTEPSSNKPLAPLQLITYPQRWINLFLFCCYSFLNAHQWIHLNIVADKVVALWNVSLPADESQRQMSVDCLSLVYMLAYIPLVFPANWILEHYGLYISAVLATVLNTLGALVKCLALGNLLGAGPHLFPVLMLGQCICAVSQTCILGIPAYLAAVWFGAHEVSTATALGVFGNQFGVASGFLIPPLVFGGLFNSSNTTNSDSNNIQYLRFTFSCLLYPVAGLSLLLLILTVCFFHDQPPTSPSLGQMTVKMNCKTASSERYVGTMLRLSRNWAFLLHTAAYGINVGVFYAIGTLLNPFLKKKYPSEESGIGWAGFLFIVAGILGSLVSGVWLDRTKSFKATIVIIYVCTLVSMALFTWVMRYTREFTWIYCLMFLLGFFMTGYLPVGYEFAAELTYPENVGVACGILNMSAQIFGIMLTLFMGSLQEKCGILLANLSAMLFLMLGCVLTVCITPHLRRQEAHLLVRVCYGGFGFLIQINSLLFILKAIQQALTTSAPVT